MDTAKNWQELSTAERSERVYPIMREKSGNKPTPVSIFFNLAFALLLLTWGSGHTQPTELHDVYEARFYQESGKLAVVLSDSVGILDARSTRQPAMAERFTLDWPASYIKARGIGKFSVTHRLHLTESGLLFTTPGTGMVYQSGPDSIMRIDRSFDHRAQKECIEFLRNNTIWRHGGYGVWSVSKALTYFNPTDGTWKELRPAQESEPAPALWNHNLFVDGDSLWVFGGSADAGQPSGQGIPNHQIWLFRFSSRTWTQTGTVNGEFRRIGQLSRRFINLGNGKVLHYEHPVSWMLDFRKNEVTTHASTGSPNPSFHGFDEFSLDNRLFHFRLSKPHTGLVRLDPYLDVLFNAEPISKIISDDIIRRDEIWRQEKDSLMLTFKFAIPCLALLGIGLTLRNRRRKSNPPATGTQVLLFDERNETISLNGHSVRLEKPELAILQLLMHTQVDIETNDLLEKIGRPELDYTQNLRIKNQVLEGLNLKIRSVLRTDEDLIRTLRSPIDRRIRIYKLNKEQVKVI